MKFKELKQRSAEELTRLLVSSREKLRDLRFRVASKQLKDVREIRETKKMIAEILTILADVKSKIKQKESKS